YRKFPSCSIRIGKALISIPALETGIARGFPILHAPEERSKGFIQAVQDILEHVGSNILVFRSFLFDVYQVTFLAIERQRLDLPPSNHDGRRDTLGAVHDCNALILLI